MGKSPGKWIKTVLFRKKSSESNFSKNVTMEKKAAAKTPAEDLSVNSQLSLDLPSQITDGGANNVEFEKATNSGTPCDNADLLSVNQVVDAQSTLDLNSIDTAELRKQEEASTKAQAAFRGYLARRAFRALKGIIRLQALIRGHLVRRQAVVTFHCTHAIVKFQALARGRIVRLSCPMTVLLRKYNSREIKNAKRVDTFGVISSHGSENLTTNAFSIKLLASLPTAMPLSLQYDLAEPNSAWNWLERWSGSHFWQPTAQAKEIVDVKSQQKQAGAIAVETKAGKSKRTVRKVSATANGDNSALASTHLDKPKRNPKKVITHQTEPVQDQPQNELERFKHNLRKVSTSVELASEKLETQTEKSNLSLEKVPNFAADISGQTVKSSENSVYSNAVVDEPALSGAPSPNTENVLQSDHLVQPQTLENGEMETNPAINDELGSKEEQTGKENQKTRRRSLPPKHEFPENVLQNTPSLPSYMQATESAKAKLRAQGASKLSEDGSENGSVRRHSLPSSANGKLNSLSPRVKGGSKTNKSLMSSKDDKGLQRGWRR